MKIVQKKIDLLLLENVKNFEIQEKIEEENDENIVANCLKKLGIRNQTYGTFKEKINVNAFNFTHNFLIF